MGGGRTHQEMENHSATRADDHEPLRDCGTEIFKYRHGDFMACQNVYTKELLNRHDAWKRGKSTSIPARDASEPEEELDRTTEEIHDAQQFAGELLWLSTKTRPVLAFAVSRICSTATRAPKWSIAQSMVVLDYLRGEPTLGLRFRTSARCRLIMRALHLAED